MQSQFGSELEAPRGELKNISARGLARVSALAITALIMSTLVVTNEQSISPASAATNCTALSLVNGSFEAPLPDPKPDYNYYWGTYPTDEVTGFGWQTTHPGNRIEFWAGDPLLPEDSGPAAFDGHTFVELNADEPSALFQDVATVPGESIVWKLAHRARVGGDEFNTMVVKIGPPASITNTTIGGGDNSMQQGPDITNGNQAWGVHTGVYVVPAGQTLTRFWFESLGGGSYGNFLDGITFTPYNCSAETPTYSPPTVAGTADGFTFQLTNYDPRGMTASATVGRVAISSSGLVSLTEVPAGTAASVTVTNSFVGFTDASVTVNANSLGSALVPRFDTPQEIEDGFTSQITNYNPDFNWTVATSDSSTASISQTGLVTVTDNPTTSTIVPVTTTRASHLSGSAFVKKTSVKLPPVVFVPVVSPPSSNSAPQPVIQIPSPVEALPKPVVIRKPVSSTIGGFQSGSAVVTADMKKQIRNLLAKRGTYKVVTVTGFLGGAGQNSTLSKQRAANVISFIKSTSAKKYLYSPAKARPASAPKTSSGGVQIVFRDK